jgi:acetylornithine/N-succinyldiaminopimelate aminotransferase
MSTGTKDFFQAIMKVLREHEIAIFVDEVQTFGRTPKLFAFQYYQLEEYVDVVSIGKLSQVCATLFNDEYKPKPGLLSQTFSSSTTALYAGLYIVRQLLNNHYFGPNGKIETIHHEFIRHFERLERLFPDRIKGPYGLGGMIAFTPSNGSAESTGKFVQDLFQAGVISFIAGAHPSRVRFLVPIGAITSSDIENVMKIVEEVLSL